MSHIETYRAEYLARRHRLYGNSLVNIVKREVVPPPAAAAPPPPKPVSVFESVITLSPVTVGKPTVAAIVDLVAQAHGLTPDAVLGKCRVRPIANARTHAIAMISECRPELSTPWIGRYFGYSDHSTVLHHRQRWLEVQKRVTDKAAAVYAQLKGWNEDEEAAAA